jgi:two-component system LytT family sensor kinase
VDDRFILVTLLVKLGVATAVASALVRARTFQNLLFKEERNIGEKIQLVLWVGVPVALGVVARMAVPNFIAGDIAFETALLLGVMGGRVCGVMGGALVSLPAMINMELATLPFHVTAGLLGGVLRHAARNREDVWGFTPFIDLSVYRWVRRNIRRPRLDWQTSFFLLLLILQFARLEIGRAWPGHLLALDSAEWPVLLAIYAGVVAVVAIPIKVWNNTRIELKLEEQQRLLLQARMEALQSQINPHFLFNTLNSVSSLVRFDPDMAREMIVKLAKILRRHLRQHDAFVQLREEVEFLDDYLDIEVVRFGRDKLRFVKELDPASLDLMVPNMLLQPLVENSLKHGLAARIEGGTVWLRSRVSGGKLQIEVEDDGVGMAAARGGSEAGTGIGLPNVGERMQVFYAATGSMTVEPGAGGSGTRVTLTMPVMQLGEVAEAGAAGPRYEARSSTLR